VLPFTPGAGLTGFGEEVYELPPDFGVDEFCVLPFTFPELPAGRGSLE
jgi:hypothetical protein